MKTMLCAAIMVFSIGVGSAYAGDRESETTGIISINRGEQPHPYPSAPAQGTVASPNGATAHTYSTSRHSGTWLFPPHNGDS